MAWYNTNWQYRKKITIDNTKVSASLTDYPVYLDLSELGTDFFDNVKNGGGDIRITTSDEETEVPREVVSCDTTAETGEVHFKGNLSGSTDTDFYVYYGNSEASDYAITATYGAENVWNSNYKAVYHLQDADDSTSNSNDGTDTDITYGTDYGKVNQGALFNGSTSLITTSFSFTPTVFSVAWWIYPTSNVDYNNTIGATAFWGAFLCHGTSTGGLYCGTDVATRFSPTDLPSVYELNTWVHCVFTFNSGTGKFYKNGSLLETKTGMTNPTNFNGFNISKSGSDSAIDGNADEVRILSTQNSEDWIATEYNNQNSPSTFYTIGIQEESKISSNTIFLSNNF